MKKYLLFLFIQIFSLTNYCQIILDLDNFTSVGDSIVEHYDVYPHESISPTKAGQNVTWDFQKLERDQTDTLSIFDAKRTLFSDSFSSSDIAMKFSSTNNIVMYYNMNDNMYVLKGVGFSRLGKKTIKNHNRIIFKYPLKYLDEHQQIITEETLQNNDLEKTVTSTTYYYKVDAWGDMKLSSGVFFSLRIKRLTTVNVTDYKLRNNEWELVNEKVYPNLTYEWWTDNPNAKHRIAELIMDSADENNTIHCSFIPAIPFEEKISKMAFNQITVHHNPSQNQISLSLTDNNGNYVNIYSLNGQQVFSNFYQKGKISIDINHLNKTTYLLIVKDKNGKVAGSSKFIKY